MAVLTATASPSIKLSLAPAAIWVARAQASPSVRLTLGPALARQPAQATPSIRLTLGPSSSTAILFAHTGLGPMIALAIGATAQTIHTATIHTGNGTTGLHGAVEEAIGYRGAR